MKKILELFIVVILAVSFTLSGCAGKEAEEKQEELKYTDIVVVDKKTTSYKVVIPDNATEWEDYAANELIYFFQGATGITLEVITDKNISFSENAFYLSVGNTTVLAGSGVSVSFDELGRDGYKLVRRGNTLLFAGGGGYGTIYAVYEFLERNLGIGFYAPDETVVPYVSELKLLDFDLTDKPDFTNRLGGYYVTTRDKVFATRMRTLAWYGDRLFQQNNIWGSWAHTHFEYLPIADYATLHPDWYSSDKTQLCLSNAEMRNELVKRLKEKILDKSDSELFMIGQEDTATFCDCDDCKAVTDIIGNSGLMMRFINDIADRIAEWQKTACPERNIKIGTFAYQRTQTPPAKQNENGVYEPLDDTVYARDNVFVLIAPIYADWCAPIDDVDYNTSTRSVLYGWAACAKSISIWGYCNNFGYNMEYFDNINTIASNYKTWRDLNVDLIFDESGTSTKQAFMFQTMMAYIHSELMWDCEQNVDELIDDFMKNYYKEAYEPMRKLFDLMRTYVTSRKVELGEQDSKYYGTGIWLSDDTKTLLDKDFWKKSVLEQMLGYVDEAYMKIANASYSDTDSEKMRLRIVVESLSVRMYLLHLFASEIEEGEYLAMVDAFESDMVEVGITGIFSSQSTAETLAEWRANFE